MPKIPLFLLTCLFISCGQKDSTSQLHSLKDQLSARMDFWLNEGRLCEGFPSKEHCDDGDANLFNGLLCSAGHEPSCDAVAEAQSENGSWWRSPRRVDGNLGQGNSFSRDMALGTLLYLAKTGDQSSAEQWYRWLKDNRPCSIKNPITGKCSVYGIWRYCRDAGGNPNCNISPSQWGLMEKVWQSMGLEPHTLMKKHRNMDDKFSIIEAQNNKTGYRLHLTAINAFLKLSIGESVGKMGQVVDILTERQPANLFFAYLDGQDKGAIAQRLLSLCPSPQSMPDRLFQWSWERADESEAWKESMIWDCVFMGRLLQSPILNS